jgi:hypothetical protein
VAIEGIVARSTEGLTCISYDRDMTDVTTDLISDPTPDDIHRYILETYPDTIVAAIEGGTFYSCDPANFPNFATVVTSDAFDDASNLSRPDAYRLNIGVSRETFQRLVGDQVLPDYTALNALMPHPVYAKQHYVSILNPSRQTFEDVLEPLLEEAHARTAAQYARREAGRATRTGG